MDMDLEPEWEWEKTCQLRAQGADDNVNGARMRMRYLPVAHSRGVGASCRMRRPSAARKARACVRVMTPFRPFHRAEIAELE